MITFDFNVSHLLGEIFTMKKNTVLSQVISQRKIITKKKIPIFLNEFNSDCM